MMRKSKNLSLRNFLLYTVTIYPVTLFVLLYQSEIIKIIGSKALFYVLFVIGLYVLDRLFANKIFLTSMACFSSAVGD